MRKPSKPARTARAASPRTARTRALPWPSLAAAFVAALAWLPSLANDFARDDGELIPAILRGARPLGPMLVSDFWAPAGSGSGLWRPFVTFSLWLHGQVGGGAPLPFHAGNVIANAVTTGVLAALLQAVGLSAVAAFAGALWFAVMPAHAEAVAWVVGRTDVLCALGSLVALLLDRRARASGSRGARVASLAAYAIALLSKETAATLVLVVFALERVDERRPALRESLLWCAPWLLVTAAWFAAHQVIAKAGGPPMYVAPGDAAGWPARAWLLLPHFALALMPGVAHAPDAMPRAWFGVAGGALASVGLIALAVVLWWKRARALPALVLFLAPLLPLVGAALAGRALPAGERLVYLSSAGAAWLLAMALAHPRAKAAPRIAFAAVALLVAWSAADAVRLAPDWKDDASVYAAMVREQPANPVGWLGTADAAAQKGDRAEAERRLARAAALGPGVPARHLVGAALHYRYGEWPQVVACADSALAAIPGLADARVLRATAYVRLRRLDEAAADTRELLATRPDDPQVLAVEGQRLLLAGDPAGAAGRLESAVAGKPDDVAAWYALGIARAVTGRAAEAQQAFERTVALDPEYREGWLGLARAAAQAGDTATAQAALERAKPAEK